MSEVIVAGGGPAGLAAAIAARQAGFEVSLYDGARPPIDKACGEGIMPDGLAALAQLGITISPDQACAFRGIRFLDDSHTVEAVFPDGVGYGIPRVLLHDLLTQRAAAIGVNLHWGAPVTGIASESIEVNSEWIPFRWLVCADGQNSPSRKKSGLFPSPPAGIRYGYRRHYRVAPLTDFVEIYWADCGQMYVTPIAHDQVCVAFITADLRLRFDTALPRFSQLALRLRDAAVEGKTIGAVTASRRLRRVQSGRIALIGEAAGSVDAITGEGLSIAFRQAFQLAAAMREGHLGLYQKAHEQIMRIPRTMSRLLLSLDRRQGFRRRVFGALEDEPGAFDHMLAIHTGAASVRETRVGQALRLGWKIMHV
jgi:2-polyprenyl-6-methoxyphenol hydroxylase-like FAD-dependent oxidoreductase